MGEGLEQPPRSRLDLRMKERFESFSNLSNTIDHPSYLGASLSLEEWEDKSDWRDLLSSGGEKEW